MYVYCYKLVGNALSPVDKGNAGYDKGKSVADVACEQLIIDVNLEINLILIEHRNF